MALEQQGQVFQDTDALGLAQADVRPTVIDPSTTLNSPSSRAGADPVVDLTSETRNYFDEASEFAGLEQAQSPFSPPLKDPNSGLDPTSGAYRVDVRGYYKGQEPLVNPLHDYESYTYNLSLHALTLEQFNNLSDSPNGYQPQNVLIAGAGKYSDTFKRNFFFQEDFYFDDLRLESVINTKKTNRFSNVVNIEFTIIEPNGFTLIQRLLSACEAPVEQGGVGGQNYIKQPFILQIDFYGQKDGKIGAGIIPNLTKLIPIRLVSMNTKVSNRGSEYRIEAVPFNHQAFSPTQINLPALFTVKAVTVQDIFSTGTVDITSSDQEARTAIENQEYNNTLAEYNDLADAFGPGTAVTPSKPTNIGSQGLAAGYNSFYRVLEQKYNVKHNKIKFVIDSRIGNKKIYTGDVNSISNAATTDNDKTSKQQDGTTNNKNKGSITFSSGTLSIPAGTNLQSVIEWAITNSEYMTEQMLGVEGGQTDAKFQSQEPLKLVKIVPRVKILEYDSKRDDYSYEITYFIKPYYVNSRAPNAPQGKFAGWVKEYNYIYTGGISPYTGDSQSNRDVIDVNLDFDMLFFTSVTAFKEKARLYQTQRTQSDQLDPISTIKKETNGSAENPGNIDRVQDQNYAKSIEDRVARATVNYTAGDRRTQKRSGVGATAVQTSIDVMQTQLLEARGDMINVQLTILGDPHFIKQDDILYNQNLIGDQFGLTPNNSLYTDSGELYVYLTFKSPIDYNETTGLAIPETNAFSYSLFTGVYKIITVTSTFRSGKFVQVLDLVRLAISDENRLKERQTFYRPETAFEVGLGQNFQFPYARAGGAQRIIGTLFSGGLLGLNSSLEQAATGIINKVFQENVTQPLIRSVGRFTQDLFGGPGSSPTDLSVVGSFSTNPADYEGVLDYFDYDFNAAQDVANFEFANEVGDLFEGVNDFDFDFGANDFQEVDWAGFEDVIGW